jgi:hypothetical protein
MSGSIAAPVAFLGLVLTAAAGCGGSDGIARHAVSGRVTLDGKPLDHGEITLNPIEAGPSAGGIITDGVFTIARSSGPSAGKYRVMIVSIRPTGRQVRDADGPPGSTVAERANVIPDRYNVRTELDVDVKNEGPNQYTFELTSAPKRGP